MTDQVSFTPERALLPTIVAASGAKARFFETGTETPVVVYSDVAGTVPISQPLLGDSDGKFVQVFYDGTVAVKCVVTQSDDSALYTIDPCPLTPTASGTATNTSATPFTGVTGTTVQEQIEQVYGAIQDTTVNAQTLVQTGGSSNAYTLSAASTLTAYATGQRLLLRINHTNTGGATLDVDSLGAVPIQKYVSSTLSALVANDLVEGSIHEVSYNGAQFVLLDPNGAKTMTGSLEISTAGTGHIAITDTAGDDQLRMAVSGDDFFMTWRDAAGVFNGTMMRFAAFDNTVRFTDYVVRFEQDIDMEQNSIADCGPIAFSGVAPTGDYIEWVNAEGLVGREDGNFRWRLGTGEITVIQSVHANTTVAAANVAVDSSGNIRRATSRVAEKDNIQKVTGCLARILKLYGYTFTPRGGGKLHQGLLADFLEQVNPLYVEDGSPSAPALIADLIGSVAEQNAEIAALKAEIAKLKSA